MRTRKIDLLRGTGFMLMMAMVALLFCYIALADSEESEKLIYVYKAEEMTLNRKTGETLLKGNAKLDVLDKEDYLYADQVTIYRDLDTNEVIKMDAVGNVDMNQAGMKATCQHAIFYEQEDRMEFEGTKDSPAVVDEGNGKSRIEAPIIIYYRKEDRIEAKQGVKGQVSITVKKSETAEEKAEEKGKE